jgi:hypothetical protein
MNRYDSCSLRDFSCSRVAILAESATYIATHGPIITYWEAWRDDIDRGLQAWPRVSHEVAKALFFNSTRTTNIDQAEAILLRYVADHLISMAGAPDAAGTVAGAVLSVLDVLDFLAEPIRHLKEDLLNTLLVEAIGMTKQDLKKWLTNPELYFDQVMTTGAGTPVTLQEFNTQFLHINDAGYSNPRAAYDYRQFPAAYNTVTLSKLILLNPAEVNRLMKDLASNARLSEPNILLGFIQTLDGDNQWANGMVLVQDCQAYRQVFMRQPGERPASPCPANQN